MKMIGVQPRNKILVIASILIDGLSGLGLVNADVATHGLLVCTMIFVLLARGPEEGRREGEDDVVVEEKWQIRKVLEIWWKVSDRWMSDDDGVGEGG